MFFHFQSSQSLKPLNLSLRVTLLLILFGTFTARCDLEVEEKITLPPFYRIEAQLLYYENVDGTIGSGQRCDIYSKCDPVFYGFLDLEKPLSPWPGALGKLMDHQYLGGHANLDALKLSNIVAKNLCGGTFKHVNLRVEVYDHDVMTRSDLIEQFECRFTPDLDVVGENNTTVTWSPRLDCQAVRRPEVHRLAYRWRVFNISAEACGMQPVSASLHAHSAARKQSSQWNLAKDGYEARPIRQL